MKRPAGYVDEPYLEWIRQLPCVLCLPAMLSDPWAYDAGERVSDPHHMRIHGGLKAPDRFCVSLCRRHHDAVDKLYPAESVVASVNLWHAAAVLAWNYDQRRREMAL